MKGWFVGATGTGCGKTWLTRGLARAAVDCGLRVAALKPIETGVSPVAEDAVALARASGRPGDASVPGFVRLRAPLSPRAAAMQGEPSVDLEPVVSAVRGVASEVDLVLVEGAGGMLTPVGPSISIATLTTQLGLPLLLVAPDRLGTLSHTLATWESCRRREIDVQAIVLSDHGPADGTSPTNARILREETGLRVVGFGTRGDDDRDLAAQASEIANELCLW